MGKDENKIQGFFGEYRWLSNFWPVKIHFEEKTYPSVEHAYQAAKCLYSKIYVKWDKLSKVTTPLLFEINL
jgi:predicted NAD-dependent protein-ADP-ribosyltransferase YbiA (DUF1768 family)